MSRSPELQRFLDAADAAIKARAAPDSPEAAAAARIFGRLAEDAGEEAARPGRRLLACRWLDPALAEARRSQANAARLADALALLEPRLLWRTRPGAETAGKAFLEGHANAYVVGPDGLEPRMDVLVGVSLMAPGLRYPDHRHPPEEVYVALSEGDWLRGEHGWATPGIGGLVYNPPDILHAMRSGAKPLLAVWCLWAG